MLLILVSYFNIAPQDFPVDKVLEALRGNELPVDATAAVMVACLKHEDVETA